jgi:hypothetical protein
MKKTMWYGLLGIVLGVGVGCQDEYKSIQQKEETHTSPPRMEVMPSGGGEGRVKTEPPEMIVAEEDLPPAAKMPPVPRGISPQAALMAKRGAEVDAYRRLAEQIKGLRIDSRTYVRDFVTESDAITADTVAHIRGVRFTRYAFIEGGIFEAEAAVGLSQVITFIKELHTRDIKGDRVKALDYQTMRQVNKKAIVTAVGNSAIRER